jgi:hypothetical protein
LFELAVALATDFAHFGSLFWPTLRVNGFRLGRKAGLA